MFEHKDKDFWEIMEDFGRWIQLPKGYILIPERTKLLMETCTKLQDVLDDEHDNCVVEVSFCPLGFGDAVVSFDADDLTSRDISKFCDAIQHLSNFEIHAVGKSQIRFSGIFPKIAMVTPLVDTSE